MRQWLIHHWLLHLQKAFISSQPYHHGDTLDHWLVVRIVFLCLSICISQKTRNQNSFSIVRDRFTSTWSFLLEWPQKEIIFDPFWFIAILVEYWIRSRTSLDMFWMLRAKIWTIIAFTINHVISETMFFDVVYRNMQNTCS